MKYLNSWFLCLLFLVALLRPALAETELLYTIPRPPEFKGPGVMFAESYVAPNTSTIVGRFTTDGVINQLTRTDNTVEFFYTSNPSRLRITYNDGVSYVFPIQKFGGWWLTIEAQGVSTAVVECSNRTTYFMYPSMGRDADITLWFSYDELWCTGRLTLGHATRSHILFRSAAPLRPAEYQKANVHPDDWAAYGF